MPVLLRLPLRAGVAACILCFIAWLFFQGTVTWQNLPLTAGVARLAVAGLDGPTVLALICTWGALLLAVLLTLALRALGPSGSASGAAFSPVRALLAWQLPPRALFASWCGGLNLAEAFGVGGWLGLNLWWLLLGLHSGIQPGDPWDARLNAAAKLLGQMTAPNLMLLFLPIPHTNVLTWLTGVSRNRLIRFHRWMGHGTLWIVLLHAVLYYVYWGVTHTFWVNFKDWGEAAGGVNNLAGGGGLAFFCGLALWGTSLSVVRRRLYEFFFRCHITCFIGFFLLSCAHYSGAWLYFTPSLLLYAADLALRGSQMNNITTVSAAAIDEGSSTATLLIRADKALQHRPPSEVWLLVPALSRWQWHPFSLASGGGATLKCHVKQYGRFTGALLRALCRRQPLAVRLSGPMGSEVTASGCQLSPPPSWRRYDTVVMVAGGVGVTAMLGMLRCMLAARQAAEAGRGPPEGLPSKAVCIWTARQAGQFLTLDSSLLAAASAKHGWLSLRLHLTAGRQQHNPRAVLPSPSDIGRHASDSRRTTESSTSRTAGLVSVGDGNAPPLPGMPAGPVRMTGASPYFWSLLRPTQPLAFSALQLAAVFVLTFFGAFCAALVGTSYMQQAPAWQGGMLICVLISAVATGLPTFFAIFPLHQARYMRAVEGSKQGGPAAEQACVVPYEDQVLLHSEACVLAGNTIVLPNATSGIRIREGRADIPALLCSVAAKTGSSLVGVYAGGPAGLMQSVHLTVCSLNGEGSGTHYELHNESVEL
ncbi:hypothetical protein ABPG75_013901 [Micractinium tetrahymenae]